MKKALQLFTFLFLFMFFSGIVFADTYIVTKNAVGDDNAGTEGSLRWAVAQANTDGDEILFSLAIDSETIKISSQIEITTDITINGSNLLGSGKHVTIEQTGTGRRVIYLDGNITLENLIITGGDLGDWGGGFYIDSDSEINLNNVTITGNQSNYGGGIFLTNSLVNINNSTISNNSVSPNSNGLGGGIYAQEESTLIIKNSLINSNNTTTSSNSSFQGAFGGGIAFYGSELRIENSTIASNSAESDQAGPNAIGGGIYINPEDATVNIVNSTIYGNEADNVDDDAVGGGIYSRSNVSILNSILVENESDGVEDDVRMSSATCRMYYCWYGTVNFLQYFTICNNEAYSSGDLTGDALDYYGGYNNTLEVSEDGNDNDKAGDGTYAYYNETDGYYYYNDDDSEYKTISDNSALDPQPTEEETAEDRIIRDQRGYYRCEEVWYGDTPDESTTHGITRGAYQYYGVVANNNHSEDWQSDDNEYYTRIQGGINGQGSGDNIRLASGTAIYEEEIDFNKNMMIFSRYGNSIVRVKDPGTTNARVFNITGSTPELSDFTIMGGDKTGDGGAIEVSEGCELTLNDVKVIGSKASNNGGGICASVSSTVTISNSQFSGNEADGNGGAINSDGILDISNSTLSFNKANYGGGIHLDNPSGPSPNTTIVNSTICNNSANNAGGIYISEDVPLSINFSTISNNSTSGAGGGILNFHGNPTIKNTLMGNNTASNGQDFYSSGGTITDNGYNIVENSSGYTWVGTGDITGNQDNLFGTSKADQQLNNNGGNTPTLKIETGSVAIEGGVYDSDVLYDQRGNLTQYTRDDPPTIGAYDIGISRICAYGVEFSDVDSDRFTVSWSSSGNSDSDGCCAFIKETSDINDNAIPVMGTSYNANTEYGLGDEIGSTGWYCFYNGTDIDPQITVTGLQVGKTYKVYASEYDGPNVLYYCRSLTSQNPNSQLIPPDEVWYCEDYCESCANDGHSWQEDAFDNLTDARNAVKDGGIVNQACEQTTPFDDYDLGGKTVELGEYDFEMTGDISGDGCFFTNGSAHLVRTGNSPLEFPLCFNGYTFYIVVSEFIGSQTIRARMNPDDYYGNIKSVIGAQWHLEGPDDLEATIQFMIPKAFIPNKSTLEQYLLSDQVTSPLWREHVANVDSGSGAYSDYWVVTVEDVDEF